MRQEEFNQLIGYRLKEVQSLLRSRMEEVLRPLGITVAQYVCLEILKSTPGASNAELARQAFVTRQTMNMLLRGLQERSLIERAEQAPEVARYRPYSQQKGSVCSIRRPGASAMLSSTWWVDSAMRNGKNYGIC